MFRREIACLLSLAVWTAVNASDYASQQLALMPQAVEINVTELAARTPLGEIDGIWQLTGGGGEMAIVPISESEPSKGYMILTLDSSDRSVLPGTVMGALFSSAKKGEYDAVVYTASADGRLTRPKRFMISLNGENHLSIVPVKNRLKVNLRNLLPYMFRVSVSRHSNRPDNLNGAVRISESPGKPLNPRIL